VTFTNAVRDLNFLMGVSEAATYAFTEEFNPPLNDYSAESLGRKMLADNRTLHNQYINQTLLEKNISLARSGYYPTLSLRAGADMAGTRTTVDGGDPSTKGSQDAYASLVFSIPLFDGGARKRAEQIARIEEETGRIGIDEMKHNLSNQLGKLVNLYDVRKNLFTVTEENMEAASLNLSISEDRLRAGTINSFNYRDVQMIYRNASLGRLNAIYNLIDTDTALARITGGIVAER
jgi:outer membrane protein TolC